MTAASARLRRTALRDYRELTHALAALAGMSLAIAAAVGIGSMLGDSDPRIPTSLTPEATTRTSVIGTSPSYSVFDDLFGPAGAGSGSGTISESPDRGGGNTPPAASNPSDGVDPGTLPKPVEVPPTPDLPGTDLTDFIQDATKPVPGGLGTTLGNTVEDVTQTVGGAVEDVGKAAGGLVGGLLGR